MAGQDPLLCWVNLFDPEEECMSFEELSDGVVLAGIFSAMHPNAAIPDRVITRKDNWVLTKGNLDEIVSGLTKVYKRFGNKDLDVSELVDTDIIAEMKSESEIRLLLEYLLTSMFVSIKAEELGTMIMPFAEDEDTKDIPEQLMGIMKVVQEKHALNPAELMDDEETSDSASPVPSPQSAHSPSHVDPLGHSRTAADYEEAISSLELQLKAQHSEMVAIQSTLDAAREEKSESEVKYQQLYDKQFSHPQEREISSPRNDSAPVQRLSEELHAKDSFIAELEARLREFSVKEEEWEQTSDELQITQHNLAEAKRELEKITHIRDQREAATKERDQYKRLMENAESKLDEDMARGMKLQSQLERAEGKLKKAEEVNAEKVIMEVKLQTTAARIEELEQELNPMKEELSSVQRALRAAKADNTTLKEELETANLKQAGGNTLADELGSHNRDEVVDLKRDLITLREELKQAQEENEKLSDNWGKSKEKTVELREQLGEYKGKLEEAEEAVNKTTSVPAEVETRIESLKEEVRLKDAAYTEVEKELIGLKNDFIDIKSKNAQRVAELEKALAKEKADREKDTLNHLAKTPPPSSLKPASASQSFPKEVQQLSQRSQQIRKGLDKQEQKERVTGNMAGVFETQRKEINRVSASFFELGKYSVSNQVTAMGASHEPQSWLAQRKRQAHSFKPASRPGY